MSRKVFISFLGTTDYTPVKYKVADKELLEELKFVQEASIRYHCSDFGEKDAIFILTTDRAKKNWKGSNGLKARLDGLDLKSEIKNISIPEGESENEIWDIFERIYGLFRDGDEVYFDITHGFRALPMLNMVLINYAKLLKQIKIKGIYYGAFEAKDDSGVAPLWDLTDFSRLQDWTNNAAIFLKTGNATQLVGQITSDVYKELKENLKAFSEFNLGVRGMDIYDGQVMVKLKEILSKELEPSEPAFKALKPILGKIKAEFDPYKKNSVINGFLAVRWCIINGLIQQAFTLMDESLISLVMEELGLLDDISDSQKRTTVSAAITINSDFIYNEKNPELKEWQMRVVPEVGRYEYKKEVSNLMNKIKNSARNDMNHAGFRSRPRTYNEFKESAKKRYKEIRKLLKKIKDIDLPPL